LIAITSRPEYGVAVLLSSFLVTYPSWLVGSGFLTLNNVLGLWLLAVIVYRVYREEDWSFLRCRELQIVLAIAAILLLSRYLQQPDRFTRELVGPLWAQDPADMLVGRVAFLVFLVAFVRDARAVRLLFALAIVLFVLTGFAGIWRVLSGGGHAGYRAGSRLFIYSAGNPNRLALFAVVALVALWHWQQIHRGIWQFLVLPVMAGLVLAIFMTASRSGFAGLVLAGLLLFAEGGLSVRKIVIGALAALFGAMLIVRAAPEKSLERIANIPVVGTEETALGAGSVARRGYGAAVALAMARENPLIGIGVGNWEIRRYIEDPMRSTAPPHSAYVTALVEGGVITLALYLVLFWRTFQNFATVERALTAAERGRADLLWIAKTLKIGLIVFLGFSFVADLWLHIVFFWFIGLGAVLPRVVFGQAVWAPARVRA